MTEPPDSVALAHQLRLNAERLRRTIGDRRSLDGVSRAQEAVLSLLDRKGPLSTADLARWERVRPQSMGATVAALVDAGLVRKSPDPADGRRELTELTAGGRAARATSAERRNRVLADLLDDRLTGAERTVLAQAFELLERVSFDEPT